MDFDWDDAKAARNLRKHGVFIRGSLRVFGDPNAIDRFDVEHSQDEERSIHIGIPSGSAAGGCLHRAGMATRSESSAPGKPASPRHASMPRPKVRHVKFTPAEMAYDVPDELDFSKLMPIIGCGIYAHECAGGKPLKATYAS